MEILEEVLRKADMWARKHAAKFAPDKFELIHFTHPRIGDRDAGVLVTSQSTQPLSQQPTSVYDFIIPDPGTDQLPVQGSTQIWLDKQPSFDTHRQKLIGKANASLEALQALTGFTWGASLSAMRAVYQAKKAAYLMHLPSPSMFVHFDRPLDARDA